MKILVPQKDLHPPPKTFLLLRILASLTINIMFFFFLLTDVVIWFYQEIYFGIQDIPRVKRSEYVVISRYKLEGLTLAQQWSCGYCEYANGIIRLLLAVANQTEIYSCAIRYPQRLPNQEYQSQFYDQATFERKG